MRKIVVCDDVDHAFQNSGELTRLEPSAAVEIYDHVAPSRDELQRRLDGAFAAIAIRDRTVVDRPVLSRLLGLRLIASTGPHRIDLGAATEAGIVVIGAPGTSTSSVKTKGVKSFVGNFDGCLPPVLETLRPTPSST